MKAVLILLAVFLLTACGSSRREPTPTPTKTPTPMAGAATSVAIETPIPPVVEVVIQSTPTTAAQIVPVASNIAIDAAERLLRIYVFHVGIEAGLADTAAQVASGEVDGFEGFGMLLASGAFLTGTEEGLKYDFGIALNGPAEVARQQQAILKEILRRWVDKEITSADVPGLLEPIDTEAAALAYVQELQRQGVTVEEIDQMMQRTQEAMQQSFEAMEENLSQPTVAAPPILVPTDTPFIVATQVPIAPCDCGSDSMNCGDFNNHAAAQACFDYCKATVGFDVHGLDGDGDGLFCED